MLLLGELDVAGTSEGGKGAWSLLTRHVECLVLSADARVSRHACHHRLLCVIRLVFLFANRD